MCFWENDDRPGQICAGIRLRIYGGHDFMGEMISLRQGQSLVEAVTSANATRAMVKTWPRGFFINPLEFTAIITIARIDGMR